MEKGGLSDSHHSSRKRESKKKLLQAEFLYSTYQLEGYSSIQKVNLHAVAQWEEMHSIPLRARSCRFQALHTI